MLDDLDRAILAALQRDATQTAASEAIRMPLTPSCHTATSRTLSTIWVKPRASE